MFKNQFVRRFVASLALVSFASFTAGQALAAGPALYPSAASGTGFPDTQGTVYEKSFSYLEDQMIIKGYADGLARPDYPLNRIEALKVILIAQGSFDARIKHFTDNTPPIPLFSDVDQTQWYAPYIEAAYEKRAVTGYPDRSFRPGQLLKTEEAVTLLMRIFDAVDTKTTAALSPYIQNQSDQWYTGSINAAINKNLIMHRGQMKLGSAITRGQFFDMVYRLYSSRANKTVVFEGPEPTIAIPVAVAPVARTQGSDSGRTGVSSFPTNSQPANVVLAPKIDHPYASEKYFSITMPSIGVTDLTITHPQDAVTKDGVLSVLKQGVGHLFSYPGGGGKMMVYGHSSGYPWDVSEFTKIFRRINELKEGDKVYVTYAGKLHIYQVTHEQTIIAKDANKAFMDEGVGEELILFTCWPPDSISQRYLVHAVPVETVALQ